MVVGLGAQGADDGTGVVVHEDRGTGGGLANDPGAISVGQNGDGTGGDGLGGEAGAVVGEAGKAHEELARGRVTRIDADP